MLLLLFPIWFSEKLHFWNRYRLRPDNFCEIVVVGILSSEDRQRGNTENCLQFLNSASSSSKIRGTQSPEASCAIEGDSKMAEIFLTNLPHDCSDRELRDWVESRGIQVRSTRIILDLETGVAPAFGYVEIHNAELVKMGAASLNGRKLRTNTVMAKPVQIVLRDFNRATVSP